MTIKFEKKYFDELANLKINKPQGHPARLLKSYAPEFTTTTKPRKN